jgi:hypothetical protein
MKVYNLCCAHDHRFEGWFASEDDFNSQSTSGKISCPICDSNAVSRLPSAPRLRKNAGVGSVPAAPQDIRQQAVALMREMVARSEDVGQRFAEEARRIHYEEIPARAIRGSASPEECAALVEEGIEVLALPAALTQPLQ